ncbi:uncharacterized protein LOC120801618 [Xiphias gladius]|uniref:uncharacterized protein LOC120801618 n=1 Tax=Xiphias gladius TaxID=8245 RepID=UPI001A999777|nr:uncharacterized protein LOC120801618 [Xiphias gladius]
MTEPGLFRVAPGRHWGEWFNLIPSQKLCLNVYCQSSQLLTFPRLSFFFFFFFFFSSSSSSCWEAGICRESSSQQMKLTVHPIRAKPERTHPDPFNASAPGSWLSVVTTRGRSAESAWHRCGELFYADSRSGFRPACADWGATLRRSDFPLQTDCGGQTVPYHVEPSYSRHHPDQNRRSCGVHRASRKSSKALGKARKKNLLH